MSIILFIVILVGLVVVHEIGHFITAKRAGIRVDEFGIGFPPRALTLGKVGETLYTLNWLPFGGFVRIFGEDPEENLENNPDRSRAFTHKPWYIQAWVLVAGVLMNVLAAWVLFTIAFMVGVPAAAEDYAPGQVKDPQLTVIQVLPESPAAQAGITQGAHILSLTSEGDSISDLSPDEVIAFVEEHRGSEMSLVYRVGESETTALLTPEVGLVTGEPERAALGISMGMLGTLKLPIHLAVLEAGEQTIQLFGMITVAIISFIGDALTLNADLSQVAGPVGIASIVDDAAALGVVSLLTFTALISLHLAVINLLPVPALDGGRLLFVLIERIKGSPIKPVFVQRANAIGFIALILLILLVTYSDITRLIS